MTSSHDHNRRAWDRMARGKQRFTRPAPDDYFRQPLDHLDSRGWLGGDVAGKQVLCLASGGGRQGPLFAAAGAVVTVVDISPDMLALDRQVAAERGLELSVVEASMDDLSALPAAGFEIVSQPVSTCYVPDIVRVYREVARVTAVGGLYLSQHKQPANLQTSTEPSSGGYELTEPYYRTGPLPEVLGTSHREAGTLEFLHRWEALIGGLCRSGFVLEDLNEPEHADPRAAPGSFDHRSLYAAPYVRLKARRVGAPNNGRIWIPS